MSSAATASSSAQQVEFVSITNLLTAQLGNTDEPRTFYRREAFHTLTAFVDKIVAGSHIGLVDGLPGTGKSSTIWWALQQPKYKNLVIAWVHFNRSGAITAFALIQPGDKDKKDPSVARQRQIQFKDIKSIKANILVLDGVNHSLYRESEELLRTWIDAHSDNGSKCAFLTMSNQIKRLHAHELESLEASQKQGMGVAQFYCTQHSWTLDEYLKAFLKDERESILFTEKRSLFEAEWEILDESQGNKRRRDGSKKQSTIREAVTQKFAHAGGSARWMMNYSVPEIDSQIDTYFTECSNLSNLLSFTLGPESPMAKTQLYASAPGDNDTTLYSMVSARATLLAVELHGTNGIKELYKHAAKLNNPAFLGWIIEADLFNRCSNNSLVMKGKGQQDAEAFDSGPPVEFDYHNLMVVCKESEVKGKEKEALNAIRKEAARLVPTTKGKMQTCKPSAWNQGGYDVVFIKASDENEKKPRCSLWTGDQVGFTYPQTEVLSLLPNGPCQSRVSDQFC